MQLKEMVKLCSSFGRSAKLVPVQAFKEWAKWLDFKAFIYLVLSSAATSSRIETNNAVSPSADKTCYEC